MSRKCFWMAVGWLVLVPAASAYYHFLRYTTRTGPFVAAPVRFDLNTLPNKTVSVFISEQGPTALASNDSFAGVVSQIRLAAKMWNDVETSDLRVAFGGLTTPGTAQSGPGIDVIFTDDIPPGLVALGGPASRADIVAGPTQSYVPINRSVVMLPKDLTKRPSYSEAFFLTVGHELGHTLGLQHTHTSSLMSTEVTRATTKAKPLSLDDIAGISVLYPTRGFVSDRGSIAGRVTAGSDPQVLASVVAITPGGAAISVLTAPDGSYRIDGIPAGQYFVYAHPLPPSENGVGGTEAPTGPDGRPFPATGAFDVQFYPGTRDPQFTLAVSAGSFTDNINFNIVRRGSVAIYGMETYGFFGQVAVKPPQVNRNGGRATIYTIGNGLFTTGQNLGGISAVPIGGAAAIAPGSFRPYVSGYAQMDLAFSPFSSDGPQHLVFARGTDVYVLPSAFTLTSKQPPSITSLAASFDNAGIRIVTITGTGFAADTRFLFDGAVAAVRSVDDSGTRAVVVPPNAPSGYRAVVAALNSDGQSSLMLQGNAPTNYSYDPSDAASVQVNPGVLAAGVETMVEITGVNTHFSEGTSRIGFGSSDVIVRRQWVVSPTRILANVYVLPGAAITSTLFSVADGLQVFSNPAGFQVGSTNPRTMFVITPVLNAATNLPSVQAGSQAQVMVANLPQVTATGLTMTLNDGPVPVLGVNGSTITFQIPAGVSVGPAVLRIRVGADTVQPYVVSIDPPPPVIVGIQGAAGTFVDATRPARGGDQITLLVTGTVGTGGLTANVGGVDHSVQTAPGTQPGILLVTFFLSNSVPSGSQPMVITQDGRTSQSVILQVR